MGPDDFNTALPPSEEEVSLSALHGAGSQARAEPTAASTSFRDLPPPSSKWIEPTKHHAN
jgi:hypothetical protein